MTVQAYMTQHNHQAHYWFAAMMLLSVTAFAGSDGLIDLPEFYRTPLSDVIYEEQTSWRAMPEDDNGWRRSDGDLIQQGRMRKEVLPAFDYEQRNDPTLGNTFMNENELARPKTNLLRVNF